jgi:hypothetical protein
MDDVAEQAGLSKGALYLYYKSKDAIIAALLQRRNSAALSCLGWMRQATSKGEGFMALAHRRPYGIYRWLANAPRWFYWMGPGTPRSADYSSGSQERTNPPDDSGSPAF